MSTPVKGSGYVVERSSVATAIGNMEAFVKLDDGRGGRYRGAGRFGGADRFGRFGRYGRAGRFGGAGLGELTWRSARRLGVGGVTLLLEQCGEVECGGGIAASIGALEGGLRAGHVPLFCEQHAEVGGGGRMASSVCATVGRLGSDQIPLLFEQRTKIERAVRIAAAVCAMVGRLGGCPLVPLFKQHAEIAGGGGMPAFIGPTVSRLRGCSLTLFFEQHPEIERSRGITALIFATVGRSLVGQAATLHALLRSDAGVASRLRASLLRAMGSVSSRHARFHLGRHAELLLEMTPASRQQDSRRPPNQPPR